MIFNFCKYIYQRYSLAFAWALKGKNSSYLTGLSVIVAILMVVLYITNALAFKLILDIFSILLALSTCFHIIFAVVSFFNDYVYSFEVNRLATNLAILIIIKLFIYFLL